MGFNSAFKGLKYIGVVNMVVWLHMLHMLHILVFAKFRNVMLGWWRSVGSIMWKINITYSQGEKEIRYIKGRNDNCICHVFRWNCLLKHVIERKMEERKEG